jgi:hypothetical protein
MYYLMPEKTRVGRVPVLILRPKDKAPVRAGLLRIHGGCILGMKEITEEFERYFTEAIENMQGLDNRPSREYNLIN